MANSSKFKSLALDAIIWTGVGILTVIAWFLPKEPEDIEPLDRS